MKSCPRRYLNLRDLDATRIYLGLYQGGVEEYEGCPLFIKGFDQVILLAPDTKVQIIDPEPIELPLEDDVSDFSYLEILEDLAYDLATEVMTGNKVLVLCRQGRNRSGLLVGMVLNLLGVPGPKAVKLIKSKRRRALTNEEFALYLRSLE